MESPVQLIKPTLDTPAYTLPSSVLDEEHPYGVLGPPQLSLVFPPLKKLNVCVNTSMYIRS
jgi:hypothetical protein